MVRLIILLQPFSRYLLIAWVIAIILVSSLPSIPSLKLQTANNEIRLDYLIHFLEYGALTFFTFLAFAGEKFILGFTKALILMLSILLFAVIDEYHQKLIPGRTFNYNDVISNILGVIAGVIFCFVIFRVIRRKIL
jgi:VanZ family protein